MQWKQTEWNDHALDEMCDLSWMMSSCWRLFFYKGFFYNVRWLPASMNQLLVFVQQQLMEASVNLIPLVKICAAVVGKPVLKLKNDYASVVFNAPFWNAVNEHIRLCFEFKWSHCCAANCRKLDLVSCNSKMWPQVKTHWFSNECSLLTILTKVLCSRCAL